MRQASAAERAQAVTIAAERIRTLGAIGNAKAAMAELIGDEASTRASDIAEALAQLAVLDAALAGKAEGAALTAALDAIAAVQASVAGKASAGELASAQAAIAGVQTALAGKASAATVAAMQTAIDGKASSATVTALQATLAGVQTDLALRALQADLVALQTNVASIVPLGTFTVATLPAPSAALLGRNAAVTDLFGNRYSRVRCERVTSAGFADLHFWQPLSSDSSGVVTITQNMTLRALTSPQSIDLTGNLLANVTRTITLDPTAGWPGCIKELRNDVTMGLGAVLNIAGTGIGSAVTLLAGGYRKFVLEYSGGSLAWRQMV